MCYIYYKFQGKQSLINIILMNIQLIIKYICKYIYIYIYMCVYIIYIQLHINCIRIIILR